MLAIFSESGHVSLYSGLIRPTIKEPVLRYWKPKATLAHSGEWLGLLSESLTWIQEQLIGYGPDRNGYPFAPNWKQWFREQPQIVTGVDQQGG